MSSEYFTLSSRRTLNELLASRFVRSVGVLVGGSVLSQLIVAAGMPVLTRLYTPAHFGVLAVLGGLVSIISVAACLRFEVAVPMPESEVEAANLGALAICSTLLISAVLGICILAVPDLIAAWFDQPLLSDYLWLLPIAVLMAGCHAALQFWFVRKKEFTTIARARIGQSVASVGTQVGLGWFGIAPLGLLLGQALNSGAGCVALAYRAWGDRIFRSVTWQQMLELFKRYDRFPKFSTLEALSNSAGMHVPILVIAALATAEEAGLLVLATYTMQAPMALIGGATAQVYLSRAPQEFRAGSLSAFTHNVLGGLLKSGVGPLLFAGLVAPKAFGLIFGEEWTRAGILVSWMTPWFVMQFLCAPVSMALHVTSKQKAAMLLQTGGLVLRVSFVYAAGLASARWLSEAYAISGFLLYIAYLTVVLRAVGCNWSTVWSGGRKAAGIIFVWCIAGLFVSLAFTALER